MIFNKIYINLSDLCELFLHVFSLYLLHKNIFKGQKYFKYEPCGKLLTSASNLRKKIKITGLKIEITNYSYLCKQKDSIVINVTKNLLEDEI